MKKTISICVILLGTLLLTACTAKKADSTSTPEPPVFADNVIISEGRLEPVRYAFMGFNTGGVVREVLVAEGDQVKAGQVLARLDNIEALEAEVVKAQEAYLLAQQTKDLSGSVTLKDLAKAYETFRNAQQRLDVFDVPNRFKGMTTAEALASSSERVEKARTAFNPYRNYKKKNKFIRGLIESEDDAWAYYNLAVRWMDLQADLDNARIQLDQVKKEYGSLGSTSATETSLSMAKFETAEANLAAARAALQNAELLAPFAGTITGVNIKDGEAVAPNFSIVSIADLSGWIVKTTNLTEIDVVDLEQGQSATITLDALPNSPLSGEVLRIGQTFTEKQGDVVYDVTVKLSESQPQMRWGMTAEVELAR